MKSEYIEQAINDYFDICFTHTDLAVNHNKGGYTNKNPFCIFMGKMTECIVYIANKNNATEPNFDLNGFDGGIDLYINNEPVSIKNRVLNYSKDVYHDSQNMAFGKQFNDTYNIVKTLTNNKCKYTIGVVRYNSNKYYEWEDAWEQRNLTKLKDLSQYFFEYESIWFSTKTGNVVIDC